MASGRRRRACGTGEVDQRVAEPALTAHEARPARARRGPAPGAAHDAAGRDRLDAVDRPQHRGEREHRARRSSGPAGSRYSGSSPGRPRAAAPSPAPRGRPSPTRSARAARRRRAGRSPRRRSSSSPTRRSRPCAAAGRGTCCGSATASTARASRRRRRAARARDQHRRARREGGEHRGDAERRRADQQQPPPADAVAERAHRDEAAGDQEAVDVDDPEQLGGARVQVGAERRERQVSTVRSIA